VTTVFGGGKVAAACSGAGSRGAGLAGADAAAATAAAGGGSSAGTSALTGTGATGASTSGAGEALGGRRVGVGSRRDTERGAGAERADAGGTTLAARVGSRALRRAATALPRERR
jgi:hypothetical protein